MKKALCFRYLKPTILKKLAQKKFQKLFYVLNNIYFQCIWPLEKLCIRFSKKNNNIFFSVGACSVFYIVWSLINMMIGLNSRGWLFSKYIFIVIVYSFATLLLLHLSLKVFPSRLSVHSSVIKTNGKSFESKLILCFT